MQNDNLRAQLYCSVWSEPVELLSLSGEERISHVQNFKLTFLVDDKGLDLAALIAPDTYAAVLFKHNDTLLRVMHGRLVAAESYLDKHHSSPVASVQFMPRAARLGLQRRTETYAGSLDEIIDVVMARSKLIRDTDYELRFTTAYPKREFVLQYQEDDLTFISRLCEYWGVYFFFEHGQRDLMVFCDDTHAIQDIAVSPNDPDPRTDAPQNPESQDATEVPFTLFNDQSSAEQLAIQAFGEERRVVSGTVVLHDYNYRLPSLALNSTVPVTAAAEGLDVEYGVHFKTPDEGKLFATRRAEALQANELTCRGESNVPTLRAGGTVTMVDHPDGNRELLVTGVRHHATPSGYTNEFQAVPVKAPYRSALVTPRPRIAGLITGMIVGEDAEDPNIDAQGRYQVALLFDVGPGASRETRPIRMLQPSSGPDYGIHFPLKPGIEVAIAFINGDPDRPIIVGSVPNPITPSPVRGERENTRRNIIKSLTGISLEMDDDA